LASSKLAAAALVTGALVAPVSASAQARYPNERPAGDPWVTAMVDEAVSEWAARGLPGPRPEVILADSLMDTDGIDALGRADGRVVLKASYVGSLLGQARRPLRGYRRWERLQHRRLHLRAVYRVILHEVGHLRGLMHTDNGSIMDPESGTEKVGAAIAMRLVPRERGNLR
jgi:hypothetical protein